MLVKPRSIEADCYRIGELAPLLVHHLSCRICGHTFEHCLEIIVLIEHLIDDSKNRFLSMFEVPTDFYIVPRVTRLDYPRCGVRLFSKINLLSLDKCLDMPITLGKRTKFQRIHCSLVHLPLVPLIRFNKLLVRQGTECWKVPRKICVFV